jgi:hypothetical protein
VARELFCGFVGGQMTPVIEKKKKKKKVKEGEEEEKEHKIK